MLKRTIYFGLLLLLGLLMWNSANHSFHKQEITYVEIYVDEGDTIDILDVAKVTPDNPISSIIKNNVKAGESYRIRQGDYLPLPRRVPAKEF